MRHVAGFIENFNHSKTVLVENIDESISITYIKNLLCIYDDVIQALKRTSNTILVELKTQDGASRVCHFLKSFDVFTNKIALEMPFTKTSHGEDEAYSLMMNLATEITKDL